MIEFSFMELREIQFLVKKELNEMERFDELMKDDNEFIAKKARLRNVYQLILESL